MPSSRRLFGVPPIFLTLLTLFLLTSAAWSQSSEGDADLDKAFSQKLTAKSTRDLDGVVELCESSIEKGLDEEGTEQAKQLAASALFEHAEQLSRQILESGARDRRWQIYRRQALSRLKQAVEFQPKMGSAWLLITKLHLLPNGNLDDAGVAVEKAVELAGDDRAQLSAALLLRAQLAARSADEDSLLADLNQAIKIDPDNMQALRLRGNYYLGKQEPEKAMEDLTLWLEKNENVLGSIEVVGRLMSLGDQFDEPLQKAAFEILDRAIEKEPGNPLPYSVRAKIHAIQEKLDESIDDINQAIKLDPNNIDFLGLRASLEVDMEEWDAALKTIDRVLEIEPRMTRIIQLRSLVYINLHQFDKAIADIQKLLITNPTNDALMRQLAQLYNANDQPAEAVKIYDGLLKQLSPESWEGKETERQILIMRVRSGTLRGRGDARLSTGEHAEAVNDYEEALDLSHQIQELEEDLELEEVSDVDAGVLNNLAWVLATSPDDDLRDGERAVELATEAAEMTEFKEAYILSTLASSYAESGEFDKAVEWIGKAIEANLITASEADDPTRTDEQLESLEKEQASYQAGKPWRERQDVEAEKNAEAEQAGSANAEESKEAAGGEATEDEPGRNEKDAPAGDPQSETEPDPATEAQPMDEPSADDQPKPESDPADSPSPADDPAVEDRESDEGADDESAEAEAEEEEEAEAEEEPDDEEEESEDDDGPMKL